MPEGERRRAVRTRRPPAQTDEQQGDPPAAEQVAPAGDQAIGDVVGSAVTPVTASRRRARANGFAAVMPVEGSQPSAASPLDLRAVPLFAELSDDHLVQVAGTVRKRRASAGQVLCREGERGDEMCVILSGAVILHKQVDGGETELGRLEAGAYFGEMALIGDAPRSATVRAATDIAYLAIDRDTLMGVIAAVPAVALQILKGYNARLAETTARLARLTGHQQAAAVGRPAGPDALYLRALEATIRDGPYPLAVLARRLQVEAAWGRKVLQALDIFELVVKYTVCLLLADYLQNPARRAPDLDQAVVAAFRRPTLGLLTDMSTKLLRPMAGRDLELFVPELYGMHFRPEGGRTPCARALQVLTTYRNRLKHGAEGVWEEETFRRDFEAGTVRAAGGEPPAPIKDQVASILDAVGFLRKYPLIQICSMTYEHGTFQYTYDQVTGAYTSLDRGTFSYPEPLENRQLYLLSRRDERALRLSPLLRRQKCPTCGAVGVFLLFSSVAERERGGDDSGGGRAPRKERLEYLSYTCGHTLVDQLSAERVERGEGLARLLAAGA
ncbi:MAG: cyclic nucleotide-binding domain-containing protein [Chloroflexota bacterium]|nr:cyclic nucleotide-binding domain-containing protein [Chloroflexota bacterium]